MSKKREIAALYSSLEKQLDISIIQEPELKDLVNFKVNKTEPVHNWFNFKEGYSHGLVERMIKEFKIEKGSVALDPFAGSGTTLLTCQWRGIYPIGVDVNPFLTFVEQAKLNWFKYKQERIKTEMRKLSRMSLLTKSIVKRPQLSSFQNGYSTSALSTLLTLREKVLKVEDTLTREFLLLGLASILEEVSHMRKDGKSLRNVKRRAPRIRNRFLSKLNDMLEDLSISRQKVEGKTFTLDARALDLKSIEREEPVDFVMFSPPYLNTFDYTEVYKLELWFLNFIKDYDEFKELRSKTLRSHNLWPWKATSDWRHPVLAEIIQNIQRHKLWNPLIPVMIQGYFDDMHSSMKHIHGVLKAGSYCVIVVGNSSYGGVPIPTDLLLAKIGEDAGFKPMEIRIARGLHTSAQQTRRTEKDLRSILRESVIVLRNS